MTDRPAIRGSGRSATVDEAGHARYGTDASAGCDVGARHVVGPAIEQIELGHAMCLAGQFPDAEACFRAAIALAPEWPMPHNNLGWSLQAQGRNEEAVVCYKQALQIDPAQLLAQTNLAFLLATLYFFIGKFDEARTMWLFLSNKFPKDQQLLDSLISTALRLNAFSDAGQWAARYAALTRGGVCDAPLLPAPRLSKGKLQHDRDQYRYLRDQGVLGEEFDDLIALYELAIRQVSDRGTAPDASQLVAPQVRKSYGRILHRYCANSLPGSALCSSEALTRAESIYLGTKPGIVVIDDFLVPQALAELQRFCLESTVWHHNSYAYDRLGAFFRDGFNCPLLLQIAEEMQLAFPNVIGTRHPLLQMWGYKYRHDQPATHPHADFAAVNVNFWITPDSANQESDSGGLIIYDIEAPMDWDFDAYNRQGDKIAAFLMASDAQRIVIPYRCNRAVIFNSDLFHATAPLSFKPGYRDQRINITMLYGERAAAIKQ